MGVQRDLEYGRQLLEAMRPFAEHIVEGGPLRKFEEVIRLIIPDSICNSIDKPLFTGAFHFLAGFGAIYSAISSIINQYTIIGESLAMKEFLKKEQHHNITDITKIQETSWKSISYIKIYIKNRPRPIKLLSTI